MLEHEASDRSQPSPHGLYREVAPYFVSGRQSVVPEVNTFKEKQVPKSQKGNPMNLRGGNTVQSLTLTVIEQDEISSQCRLLLTQYFMMNEQMET